MLEHIGAELQRKKLEHHLGTTEEVDGIWSKLARHDTKFSKKRNDERGERKPKTELEKPLI